QLAAVARYDAAADIESQRADFARYGKLGLQDGCRVFALQRSAISDLDKYALGQHIGPHGDALFRRVFERLLGMHEQVEEDLFQLPLRAQNVERRILYQV